MKEYLKKYLYIFVIFALWRIGLWMVSYFANIFPLQNNFLGGGMENYLKNPALWSLANFDGEHYVALVREGYRPLTHFFFPLYPAVVGLVTGLVGNSLQQVVIVGVVISNLLFLLALIGIHELLSLDYKINIVKGAIIAIVLFPTSFYFSALYTESLFLCLTVWSFYAFRKNKFMFAGILGFFSSLTRLIGIILAPAYLTQLIKSKKLTNILWLLLIPAGLASYMYYLYVKTGDPLVFFNTVGIFGEQRSSSFVFLPQVFYRYIFKIIPSLNYSYFPTLFTTILEFVSGTLFFILVIVSFWKLRVDYAVYMLLGYIIPTLSGSFSSLPRYVIVLFPAFILISTFISNKPLLKIVMILLSGISLAISFMLFSRGYWLA